MNKNENPGRPGDGDEAEGTASCPLVGWESEIHEDLGCFMFRPCYLDHPQQIEPHAGNRYVLSAEVCRQLAEVLLDAAEKLDLYPSSSPHQYAN